MVQPVYGPLTAMLLVFLLTFKIQSTRLQRGGQNERSAAQHHAAWGVLYTSAVVDEIPDQAGPYKTRSTIWCEAESFYLT